MNPDNFRDIKPRS